ncbi:MAG: transglycosylase domain-containing protein, partial [Clostridia bacterium]|nr:transglycosylase domain-containing protein [Clostridia bacterium]
MKKIILAITYAFCVISIFFIGAAMFFIAETKDAVFDDKKLKRSYSHCEIYAADGAALDETQSDVYVTIDTLPENVKKSFIAIEDKRFYEHNGVDPRSVLRALKNNLLSSSVKEGGSTISQQLIKNVFLSSEKTISRKLKEIKLTYILENKYTKDEILELYLNNVYFGEGAYGIYEASEKYFGITPDKLDLCQSALLAALVKAPSFYDPYVNMDAAKSRRDLVIDKMAEQNYIAEDDVKELKKSDIILNNTKNYDRGVTVGIMKEAKGLLGLNAAADLDGYKIYTSIDRELCSAIPTPKDYGIDTNYTILVSDNKAKRLIAASYNVTDLKRCPASSAKPWLIYAPAIEERAITEATKIDDSKTDFNGYTPSDFGEKYYGFISAKECLAKSLNVPAVKIATCIGLDKISEYAKKMNITYDNDDLSVAIGNLAGGITVNQLLDAYTVFSNDGFFYHSSPIEKIVDKNGYTVYKRKEKERKVFSDGTAFIINDMLKETVKSGTAKKLSSLGYEICAKTGTNGDKNGNTDAYCVAYTPEYTVVVWLGNN